MPFPLQHALIVFYISCNIRQLTIRSDSRIIFCPITLIIKKRLLITMSKTRIILYIENRIQMISNRPVTRKTNPITTITRYMIFDLRQRYITKTYHRNMDGGTLLLKLYSLLTILYTKSIYQNPFERLTTISKMNKRI
ncbi:hypothetical protein AYR47_27820 [Pseudomonas azotoformans]|uniref:Uncharacterized protein n=1 Tax=Pseudomonas azotoformans TaxID=47878 RepID=A0A127I501_PSEAZ|nr:hypothetical protein AYR47_27820 [Pseudomonas azotoformans]